MEEFKRIAAYPDYEIGTQGTVRSLKFGKVKVLTPHPNTKGHLRVQLYIGGKKKIFLVHRLVAQAFIPNPDNKPEVNHINGIKTDNRVENLEWCTRAENVQHAYDTGLKVTVQGEESSSAKLTNEQARFIRENTDGLTCAELGEIFDVSQQTIIEIQLGNRYKTAGGTARESKNPPCVTANARDEIRRLYVRGSHEFGCYGLAEKFGVDPKTIWRIIHEQD